MLSLNPDCLIPLQPYQGQVIELILLPLNFRVFLHIKNNGMMISSDYQGIVTTKITSGLPALLRQTVNTRPGLDKEIKLEGNIELAQALSEMLKTYPAHHEEFFSFLVGDVVTQSVKQTAKNFFGMQKRLQSSMQSMFKEYVQEELRTAPGNEEVEDCYNEIYDLQNDVDRLAMKLQYLQKSTNLNRE